MHVISSVASRWQYLTDGGNLVIIRASRGQCEVMLSAAQKKNEPQK